MGSYHSDRVAVGVWAPGPPPKSAVERGVWVGIVVIVLPPPKCALDIGTV